MTNCRHILNILPPLKGCAFNTVLGVDWKEAQLCNRSLKDPILSLDLDDTRDSVNAREQLNDSTE